MLALQLTQTNGASANLGSGDMLRQGQDGSSSKCHVVRPESLRSVPYRRLSQVINKLKSSVNTRLILIAPYWTQQEWFPDLWTLSVEEPLLLPHRRDLLKQPHCHRFHLSLHTLQLTAWRLSSYSSEHRDTRRRWPEGWPDPSDLQVA